MHIPDFRSYLIRLKKNLHWGAFYQYRHYLLFLSLPVLSLLAMVIVLVAGERSINTATLWVDHGNIVISKNQEFIRQIESMLASQRGYVMSGDQRLNANYTASKGEVSDLLAEMNTLMESSPSQVSRLNELQHYFLLFTSKLDDMAPPGRAARPAAKKSQADKVAVRTVSVDQVKENISRISNDILLEEHDLQNKHMKNLERKRTHTRAMALGLCLLTALLFLLFNGYLFRFRLWLISENEEPTLREAEDVFRLAIEGSSDGIFEWNLERDKAFYSRQFWNMLGYEPGNFSDTMQSFKDLLHPEDYARVLAHIDNYLGGTVPEYLVIFRLKHKTGRWVWINARGKAMYDEHGKPYKIVGAHTDISHIKAYEEKLEKAKETAEKANRAKTDFLAHMSHEIRTPLTAISGIAEIFGIAQEGFDDKQKNLIRALNSSTSSLKDLVSDILDFSKIESGELELEEKTFALRELFDQVTNIVSVKADEKKIKLDIRYEEVRALKFLGDRARLRQILINLIGNAIKFTNEGGMVEVIARKVNYDDSPFLSIDVRDTGIGIDPDNFELIFERFKQADSSVSRKYGGTGLGLPISMRLARLMGGNIMVQSELGSGSTFTVVVPLRTEEIQASEENERHVNKALSEDLRNQDFQQKRILLVEDYEGNIVLLSYLLDSLSCQYDIARTGLEALNAWRNSTYDLILMDIQMPEMDGFTATAQIRNIEREKSLLHTPIIGMTAHALIGDKEKCIEAGMDAYLPKPIVEVDLKAKIVEFLTQKKKVA